MTVAAILIPVLILVSGLVAFIGNLVGRNIGRRRLTLLGLRPARKVRLSSVLMKAVAPVSVIKSFPPSCSKMVLGTVKSVILAILLVSPLLAGCDAGTRALPCARCPLVALTPSGDLFVLARDLFV